MCRVWLPHGLLSIVNQKKLESQGRIPRQACHVTLVLVALQFLAMLSSLPAQQDAGSSTLPFEERRQSNTSNSSQHFLYLTRHCEALFVVAYSSSHHPGQSSIPSHIMATETRRSREILVAVDAREGSKEAFIWALENLIREGDVVTLLNVKPTTGLHLPLKSG